MSDILSKLPAVPEFLKPLADKLPYVGQLLLSLEISAYSPFSVPLFGLAHYFKNELNKMDNTTFFGLVVPSTTIAMYWIHGAYFWHTYDKYKASDEIKHQKKYPFTPSFSNLIWTCLRNQFFFWWPTCYGIGKFMAENRPEVDAAKVCALFAAFALVDEILFFYPHWLCHANSFLYQKVHKIHHTHTVPFAFAAEYAHPVEEMFVNIMPTVVGYMLLGGDNFTIFLWQTQMILGTQNNHCGYKPKYVPNHNDTVKFHDDHHRLFTKNYGTFGLLDWIHGTLAK